MENPIESFRAAVTAHLTNPISSAQLSVGPNGFAVGETLPHGNILLGPIEDWNTLLAEKLERSYPNPKIKKTSLTTGAEATTTIEEMRQALFQEPASWVESFLAHLQSSGSSQDAEFRYSVIG